MKSIFNDLFLIGRIILPAIICLLFNYLWDGYNHLGIIVIPFAVSIVVFSIDKMRYNTIITLLVLVILSLLLFFGSILLGLGIGFPSEYFLDILNTDDNFNEIIYKIVSIISFSIIPLILAFLVHGKLFKIPSGKFTKYIKCITLFLISVLILLQIKNGSLLIGIWEFILAFALQLLIYQKEIRSLMKN